MSSAQALAHCSSLPRWLVAARFPAGSACLVSSPLLPVSHAPHSPLHRLLPALRAHDPGTTRATHRSQRSVSERGAGRGQSALTFLEVFSSPPPPRRAAPSFPLAITPCFCNSFFLSVSPLNCSDTPLVIVRPATLGFSFRPHVPQGAGAQPSRASELFGWLAECRWSTRWSGVAAVAAAAVLVVVRIEMCRGVVEA